MAFEATAQQKEAIEAKGNLLVAAAAGSGKTAVLVERVIAKLTDRTAPVSADRLLIVTFTNAAAAEMRARIEKRLNEECRKNPQDAGLLRQKHLIGSAKICTIDSFCIDLVRENFARLSIEPDFKISDTASLRPVDEAVLSGLLREYYEQGDPVFFELLDLIGSEYDDGAFSDFLLGLYSFSRQLPFPGQWFDSLTDGYCDGRFSEESEWARLIFLRAESLISDMAQWLATATDLISGVDKAAEKYYPCFLLAGELLEELLTVCRRHQWDAFYEKLSGFCLPSLPSVRGFAGQPEIAAAKLIFKGCGEDLTRLKKLVFADSETIGRQHARLEKPVRLLAELLKQFDDALFREYKARNTFTFHNTEHLALALLCGQTENGSEQDAEEFLSRYDEVMVDEYQDTNDLQDRLFYVLSGKESKLFVVGDVKQSIYGFRGANPTNFLEKKNRYLPIAQAGDGDPKRIILSSNFRCHPEVCRFVNFFFGGFMNEQTGSFVYDGEEELVPAAVYPETGEIPVEIAIIDGKGCGMDSLVLEARQIAAYIKEIMGAGACIRKSETELRPASYSDFTILMRSTKHKAAPLAAELRKQGIPVNFGTEEYAESVEVAVFLSLLTVIDNPHSDIELLTVMMSPIFGFSADDMAQIRIAAKDGDLCSAVIFSAQQGNEKAGLFLKRLEHYRVWSVTASLPRLIAGLLDETQYLNVVSAMQDGDRRRRNLLLLQSYAEQYMTAGTGGPGEFAKYIKKQSENGIRSAAAGGADTVRIMSIHASKGLQFPVCIVADTASEFNSGDARSNTLYDTENGIGFRYYDEEQKTKRTTVGREVILDRRRRREREEELRLLYVAMTRTQDRLLFTAAVKDMEKALVQGAVLASSCGETISSAAFGRAKSYFHWLLLSALRHPDGAELRQNTLSIVPVQTDSRFQIRMLSGESLSAASDKATEPAFSLDLELVKAVRENAAFVYPFEALLAVEAKSSVSALANRAESDRYAFRDRPAFLSDGGITASERGTAMHRVMQYIDFDKTDRLEEELERLCEWQFISEREAAAVNREALCRFFESDLFSRIRKSPLVKREMRFLTELPAEKVSKTEDESLVGESVMVQGAVDLCFEEDGAVVVLDFKTDRVTQAQKLAEVYGEQLSIYAVACEKIFQKPVKQKLIYSFSLGTIIET